MNIERLTEIAEWLEAGAPKKAGVTEFSMRYYIAMPVGRTCGTAACIAGAAVQFDLERRGLHPISQAEAFYGKIPHVRQEARAILDLDYDTSKRLFLAISDVGPDIPLDTIDPAYAARVIWKLIATGVVDWDGTAEAP